MSIQSEIGKNQPTFFGHPIGLAILFFTEMWERFSYYGMRGLLVLFLIAQVDGGIDAGYGWTRDEALLLYGIYTALVYIMSIPGGIIADRLLGQKKSVMLGGGLLVIGQFMLAFHSQALFFSGLGLIFPLWWVAFTEMAMCVVMQASLFFTWVLTSVLFSPVLSFP